MTPLILPAAVIGATLVLAIVMRVHVVYLFFAVTVGALLVDMWGDDAASALSGFIKGNSSDLVAKLVLLCLPALLTMWFLRKSTKRTALPMQIVPLVATAVSLAILVVNQLSRAQQASIYNTTVGSVIKPATDVIVAGTAVVVLVVAWLSFRHKEVHGHGKHHK